MRTETKKRQAQWFVEPMDPHTNRVVWDAIRDNGGGEESLIVGIRGTDGRVHNVYRVPDHRFLLPLIKGRRSKSAGLYFNIYNRFSPRAKLRPWPFV
jgi:hypothetical protein